MLVMISIRAADPLCLMSFTKADMSLVNPPVTVVPFDVQNRYKKINSRAMEWDNRIILIGSPAIRMSEILPQPDILFALAKMWRQRRVFLV